MPKEFEKYFITTRNTIYKKCAEEIETIINFDYYEKSVNIYTNRITVLKKLIRILGEPTNTNCFGGSWTINFTERNKIKKIMAMSIYLPRKIYNE